MLDFILLLYDELLFFSDGRRQEVPFCGKCKEGMSALYGGHACGECEQTNSLIFTLISCGTLIFAVFTMCVNMYSIDSFIHSLFRVRRYSTARKDAQPNKRIIDDFENILFLKSVFMATLCVNDK